jgi:hypothetical protein
MLVGFGALGAAIRQKTRMRRVPGILTALAGSQSQDEGIHGGAKPVSTKYYNK